MAKLIPDFVSDECKSSAERKLFHRFGAELDPLQTVLHSLGVARHRYKLYSEADFVLVDARAVIVFEVKGGRIARRDGSWFFQDRYGQLHRRRESPMQQAASVCAALRKSVAERFGAHASQARVAYGSVTFFPDIPFSEVSPEWDSARVYDQSAWDCRLSQLVSHAIEYSIGEMKRITGHVPAVMSPEAVTELLDFLRGDFERIPSLGSSLKDVEEQMVKLAPQQFKIFDQLAKNRRILMEGSAGTGKTLLAIECARRHAAQGRRVLYVCFNRLLADHVYEYATLHGISNGISIDTLHGHCLSVLRAAHNTLTMPEAEPETYLDEIPAKVEEALAQLRGFKPWDVLIVDEGQDLAGRCSFLNALARLLEGGFSKGSWIWFEDPEQRIFHHGGSPMFDLNSFEPSFFRLTKNWRNTDQVAKFTSVSTLVRLPELSGVVGPEVRVSVCRESWGLELNKVVAEILSEGAEPEEVVILTVLGEQVASFSKAKTLAGKPISRYSSASQGRGTLRYSSVFRFKGLESKIIILTDVKDLGTQGGRMSAYVGMSRATCVLCVLLSIEAEQQWQKNRLDFADFEAQHQAS